MPRLIDFSNYKPPEHLKVKLHEKNNTFNHSIDISEEQEYNLTLDILINNNSGKVCFTLDEVGKHMKVGQEFLRRRIKCGIIKVTYFGDKPMVNITELARILTQGIK